MNGKLKTLLIISRPRFWIYLAGPYLIGYSLSASNTGEFIDHRFFLSLLYFLIPANVILYGINDIFDRQTDLLNVKKRSKENLLKSSEISLLRISILISLLLSFLPIYFSKSIYHLIIFLSFIALSFTYSSPPFRFKSIPFLDSFSNVLYGLPAVWGFMQNSSDQPSLSVWVILFSWNAGMHLFSAIPDIDADKKTKINTTAVFLRKKRSLIYCSLLWLGFSLTTILSGYFHPYNIFSLIYPLIPLLILVSNNMKIERVYWYFPLINGFLGFLLFWVIAFDKFL